MVDLETLGTAPGSVIVSIGAVKLGEHLVSESLYLPVDPRSCEAAGMTMDAETVLWWLRKEGAARKEICRGGLPLREALERLAQWLRVEEEVEIWGNGASFDPVLLGAAFDAVGIERPWSFKNERCYRTVAALFPEVPRRTGGTRHNALDDAVGQGRHLIEILRRIREEGAAGD